MILKIFGVYDSKIGTWMQPSMFQHAGQALRAWVELANDPNSMVSKHPQDFAFFELGTFDDEKGVLESLHTPKSLMTGLEAKQSAERPLNNSRPNTVAAVK